ncbi:MAG: cell division topological specificity factor MinE [Clostridia bacterium]|nr:cell division topological specificity factor MinE [Clostridia bacterium]
MKNELQIIGEKRLKNVLTIDKSNNPDKIKGVILSEIINVLNNYMNVTKNDIDFDVAINDKGGYTLKLFVDVKHLKLANHIL